MARGGPALTAGNYDAVRYESDPGARTARPPAVGNLDAAVYTLLQHRRTASSADLVAALGDTSVTEVSESLVRLRAGGLVQVLEGVPPRYAVGADGAPSGSLAVADRAIAGRRTARTRPPVDTTQRNALRGRHAADSNLEILVGPDQVRRAAEALQRAARRCVQGIDKPPYAGTSQLNLVERELLGNGVTYQVIYDRAALAPPGRLDTIAEAVELGEQARVAAGVPMKLLIVDHTVAVVPLDTAEHTVERALVVRGGSLLASFARVFSDLWRAAAVFGSSADTDDDTPTGEDRHILALLAAGATDEAIGRSMGFSPRTAHRRVRDLVARLGVETRFQAGMQAVRLGWL